METATERTSGLGVKALAASITAVALVVGYASAAYAQTPTPASEATSLFSSNWGQVLDTVKAMAPIVIGAGLTLLVIRKVVGAVKRGKAPSF